MKIYFVIFFFFLSSFCQKLSIDDQSRFKYYKDLLQKYAEPLNVELAFDQEGLFLRTSENLISEDLMYGLPHKFMIDGCIFYPFKEQIYKVISKIFMNLDQSKHKLKLIILLAYQILYYKFGDYENARKYYFKQFEYESIIYRFIPTTEHLEYIDIIFKKIPFSLYTFNQEDLELSKTFHFDIENDDILMNSFNAVLSLALNHQDDEARVYI